MSRTHGKQLVKKFALDPAKLDELMGQALGATAQEAVEAAMAKTVGDLSPNAIVKGRVLRVLEDGTVFIDVGYKSEGRIPLEEFDDPTAVVPGMEFECLVEAIDDEDGYIELSKRRADRIRGWERVIETHKEGDVVEGAIVKKTKGGLLVDIGVPVFLPASQVNIRRTGDIGDWIGKEIEARIIKIDEERMNIVISRRKLIEEERETKKAQLLAELAEGQVRKGIVKNIADFGAFVDLGGIDGLLHITDMSWSRLTHPSDMLKIDDEVEVMVLRVGAPEARGRGGEGRDGRDGREGRGERDRRGEGRIGLSLKACQADPWETRIVGIEEGNARKGRITRTTEFGAFVELAPGVEGLLHITELGRDLKHANERVKEGDDLWVVVERVDVKAKRISLSKLSDSDRKLIEQGGELPGGSQKPLRVGTHTKVKVEKVEPAGVFVQVEGVVGRRGRGFIPNAEMGTERGTDHRKKFPPGMELDVKVIGNDRDGGLRLSRKGFHNDEERRAVHDYRREAATKGFGTFGDLLRNKLQK